MEDKDFVFQDFNAFIYNTAGCKTGNGYTKHGSLTIYMRRSIVKGCDYDLANISSSRKGRGEFTRFLNFYERFLVFRVENIFNKRLVTTLLNRGYLVEKQTGGLNDDALPITLISPQPTHKLSVVSVAFREYKSKVLISMPAPSRHHHLFEDNVPIDLNEKWEQGFLASDGTFLTRIEARIVAMFSGQTVKGHHRELFSEDVW